MHSSSNEPLENNSSESAPSPARLRAEARKAKILAKGNDRLAKITGAMKGRQPMQTELAEAPEPPEVDISQIDQSTPTRSSSTTQSLNSNVQPTPQKPTIQDHTAFSLSPSSISRPAGGGMIGQDESDPIFQMMKSMGLDIPPIGSNSQLPNPMLQQALAGMSQFPTGTTNSNPPTPTKTWIDRLFPILNLITVIGLILSASIWWNPISKYWTNWNGLETDREIDLKTEWDTIYPPGSSTLTRQTLGPAPVFWMFVTIELGLQATRWIFNRNNPPSNNLLNTLIHSIPQPYSTILISLLKYFNLIISLFDDLSLLIFCIGCLVIYLDHQELFSFGNLNWVDFISPVSN